MKMLIKILKWKSQWVSDSNYNVNIIIGGKMLNIYIKVGLLRVSAKVLL